MGQCIPCIVNSIKHALRTGVFKWDSVKPQIKELCRRAGYDPTQDPKIAALREARRLRQHLATLQPHTTMAEARATVKRVTRVKRGA
jgi:hypothetical protein